MAGCQSVARKGKKPTSKWEVCYGCGNRCKGTRGLKIHYLHSPTCLNSDVPVNDSAVLESPSIQPPSPHVERIRQSAPAEFFNRSVGSSCVVEDSNDRDDDLDFGSASNDFEDNDEIQQPHLDVPDPSIENADEIGDGNATFPDSTIMDAFEEHRKSGKAFDVSLFSDEERVLIDLLHTLKKLRTPLKAYSEILKWAVRSTSSAYSFQEGPQTSQKFILSKMQSRMYQDKFTPHEHALYLPYSQAHVNVVYFDAKEVLRSLLTCPMLNKDDTYHVPQHSAPQHLQPICKVRRENPVRHQYGSFLPQNL